MLIKDDKHYKAPRCAAAVAATAGRRHHSQWRSTSGRSSPGLQLGARLPSPMCTAANLLTTVQHRAATDTLAADGLGGVRRLHGRQDDGGACRLGGGSVIIIILFEFF